MGASASGSLFQRRATGLLRGWSLWDAAIYATLSVNLVTLGFYIFSFAPFIPHGALIPAVVISGILLLAEVTTYAGLIAVMPRAGGDYIWISRILHSGLGCVLALTGWWFILWHWVPIYAAILNMELVQPIAFLTRNRTLLEWSATSQALFILSVFVAILAAILVSLGMRVYARIQNWCFYIGVIGLLVTGLILALHDRSDFIRAYNGALREWTQHGDAYQATLQAGALDQSTAGLINGDIYQTLLLLPMLAFFNLWANWGATLYGEVRGASDFRRNIYAMGGALVGTSLAGAIFLALLLRVIGLEFFYSVNNAYWSGASNNPLPVWPYPVLLASLLVENTAVRVALIIVCSLWFFGWCGTVFLSSTRVVFAAAFDRLLPEWVAVVSRRGVPYVALLLMFVPSLPLSYLYAYNATFRTWTLDATLVIAMSFLGSTIAALVLPWRRPNLYWSSPIASYRLFGVPGISIAASVFTVYLLFCLYQWLSKAVYGVNNTASLLYMLLLYIAAFTIYVVARIIRGRQGIDLGMIYSEIPSE
jgi:APA family basic amino acid/polyamine antiporter